MNLHVVFICLGFLLTGTRSQSVPPQCVNSPTNRLPEVTDITVTCGTRFMDLSILLCPIYNANFNESLLILNNQSREECKGRADFSVDPPVLRYRLSVNEQSVLECNNKIQISNHIGTGDFEDFSSIQYVTISGMVVTFDPATGLITYRPQVTYMFSCRYPLQYVMNNTHVAVAGVDLAINENNGSFISSLKFSLYSNEFYNESLMIPETGLPLKTNIYAEISATSLADRFNVLLWWCKATVAPLADSTGYNLFVGCNRDARTTLGDNGVSENARFVFQAFRFVEHQNLKVSTFFLHCYTALCPKDQCASMLPNCTEERRRRKRDVTDSHSTTVTSPPIMVGTQGTVEALPTSPKKAAGGDYSGPVVAVIVCVAVIAFVLVGMGACFTWIHRGKVPL